MSRDFYVEAAARRASVIEAELAASKADLLSHRANGDVDSASQTVQQIANLTAEQQNLSQLYQSYVQSQQPPQQEELTDAERFNRPWSKMTPQDALELAKTSKYGKDLSFDDPHVRAGWVEANRRRSRGE